MKSHRVHKSRITPTALKLLTLFIVLLLQSGIAICGVEPVGRKVGVVQFDAIIELNSYLQHTHVLIFARYWVGPDYYSVSVIWAEPHGGGLNFAVYPPTLSLTSDKDSFDMTHDIYKVYDSTYPKPLGERGVFRFMFGDYPIPNIRFADQEALEQRIYVTDLRGLEDANQSSGHNFDVSVSGGDAKHKRDVAKLNIRASGERIDSMRLFNTEQHLLSSITYEYEKKVDETNLISQNVTLAEQPQMIGFRGEGITMKMGDKKYQFRDIQTVHHRGGRTCTVEYKTVPLGKKVARLPSCVTVYDGQKQQVLRCAHLMNFKQVELDVSGAEKMARQFGGFTEQDRKYRELLSKYWEKNPKDVEIEDLAIIKQLLTYFERIAGASDMTVGERLKYLNILMELNRLIGDEENLERFYQCYLRTLSDNKLWQMLLVGGYGAVETPMLWGRYTDANRLLRKWIDEVRVIKNAELVLHFALTELDRKHLWTTAKLLESFSQERHFPDDAQFEGCVLRCQSLNELCKLLRDVDNVKNKISQAQVNWVMFSTDTADVENMLIDILGKSESFFTELTNPTEAQQSLKAYLDKITEECKQRNSEGD
jgi:hypothetical protein